MIHRVGEFQGCESVTMRVSFNEGAKVVIMGKLPCQCEGRFLVRVGFLNWWSRPVRAQGRVAASRPSSVRGDLRFRCLPVAFEMNAILDHRL